jgi:hypothetical protein
MVFPQPVDKKLTLRLTGPVNHGVLFKVICLAQNPSAAMRGGFLRWGVARMAFHLSSFSDARLRIGECWIGPVRSTMPDSSPAPVDKEDLL